MIYGTMAHASHPGHTLNLECKGAPYKCDGCKEVGFGLRYTCEEEECNFHLHKCCASSPPTISHRFFKGCNFEFLEVGKPNRCCDACGGHINGFVYHCDCGYDLHPCCAHLDNRVLEGEIELVLHKKVSSKCNRCGIKKLNSERRSTWTYVSTCKEYHFHISCVKEMILDSWEKEFLGDAKGDGALVLESRTPKLQLVVRHDKKKGGRLAKYARMAKLALTFIIAALLGDPTALAVGLITSLITH